MESTTLGIEGGVDDLLAVLDEDIRHVRASLLRLDELRSLVVKRDQAALGGLLERIRGESQEYSTNESKRESIRREFAAALDCGVGDVTLSRLEAVLPGENSIEVAQRKAELRSLTEELKREHSKTMMLLSDCARFNSALLRDILELGRTGAITYGSDGAAKVQSDSVFVSLQL
ncbi:MAG: flagellar export chaperone FlgN [Phycisphaerae bacterium]|nr:flagellar export chaperone FlgN [Phycisphaerae bacterium]